MNCHAPRAMPHSLPSMGRLPTALAAALVQRCTLRCWSRNADAACVASS